MGTSRPLYNFRLAPEAIWLIANTVLGVLVVEALAFVTGLTALPGWDDLQTWLATLAIALVRSLIGAVLTAATGGAFLAPGEPPTTPTTG